MRKRPLMMAVVVAAGLAASSGALADEVTVGVSNPGGSRTVHVEDVAGRPLSSLDLGTAPSQPFRVRVVDDRMNRTAFSVSAAMTHLYKVAQDGSALDFGARIESSAASVSYATQPIALLNAKATVAPLVDASGTVSGTVCTTLTTLGASCAVGVTGVTGKLQQLAPTIDAALTTAPLLPQTGDTGAFAHPAYAGVAAAAPKPSDAPEATSLAVVRGSVVTTTAVLDAIKAALDSAVNGKPASDVVEYTTLTAALRSTLGAAVYDALTVDDIQTIVSSLTASARAVTPSQVRAQSGTYLSYPVLNVAVPSAAASGDYRGTLVVTALQG